MLSRRHLLAALAAAPGGVALAQAPNPSERGGPLRLGADRALVESGLARSLQHAFGADTGIAVLIVPGPGARHPRRGPRRRGRRRAAQRPRRRAVARHPGPGPRPPADHPGRVHPGRAGAAQAGARPPAASGQERRRGARQDPRPGLCRSDQPGLPERRRRLGRPRRRAGALARGQDRAGGALVRRRRSRSSRSSPRRAPRARMRWSSAAPGRRSAARRSRFSSKAIRSWSSRCMRCARFASATRPARSFSAGSPAAAAAPRSPRTPARGRADGSRDGTLGTAAQPQRRPRQRGRDQRPARHDRDRQARRRRAARGRAARHRRRRAGRPVGARRPGQGGLRLPERALPVLADGARAGRRRALGRAAAARLAGREPDRRRGPGKRRLDRRRAALSRIARWRSASRAIRASSSTPRWASSTPPS